MTDSLAGRAFGEVYHVRGKADIHEFLLRSVEASGARVLYASDYRRAPLYLGVQVDSDQRLGVLVYPFRITRRSTYKRPEDEVRGQLRLGAEATWQREHPVARDIAGVDVTMILGVDLEDQLLLGLDSALWDPLPMGISFYLKQDQVEATKESGWHVWEKVSRRGKKRAEARSGSQLETLVAFTPDRLIDYAILERRSTSLGLDPPLRFSAAQAMAAPRSRDEARRHVLEEQFALSSEQILDIIGGRNRLSVAVRGGVAEYHLEKQLQSALGANAVKRLDMDAMHDFDVRLRNGHDLRIECKNASPKRAADGTFKVEVQKTRASKGDPASRFYPIDGFDVVAACLFSPTGQWRFVFGSTSKMLRHRQFPDRLAAIQPITSEWADELEALTPL